MGGEEPFPNRPPKNKMESHFQLSLVQDELDRARQTKSGSAQFKEADQLRNDGQAAYDRQDYTEALRLALKSRRTLGTRIEALPLSPASTVGDPGAPRTTGGVAEPPTFGRKCARCGRIAAATDEFCRGCGAPITPALCSSCGAPLLAGDRFCGKCGATQA
jgi:Double zinc ribbon